MTTSLTRREFLSGGCRTAGLAFLNGKILASTCVAGSMWDSSAPGQKISSGRDDICFGYAAISWGNDYHRAINEISETGFRGIQLRADVLREFGSNPATLKELLREKGLTFVGLSSGDVVPGPQMVEEEVREHAAHAKFVSEAGGKYLQIIDSWPGEKIPEPADYKQLGVLLTEIGKRSADQGIVMGYHNHMGSLSEVPQGLEQVRDAVDTGHVKLILDVAHYFQGGGDPASAIRNFRDWLLYLHIKDVQHPAPGSSDARSFDFVELGSGQVDLPAIFQSLREIAFKGWAVVELDSERSKRPAKESAARSKRYLEQKLGLRI